MKKILLSLTMLTALTLSAEPPKLKSAVVILQGIQTYTYNTNNGTYQTSGFVVYNADCSNNTIKPESPIFGSPNEAAGYVGYSQALAEYVSNDFVITSSIMQGDFLITTMLVRK